MRTIIDEPPRTAGRKACTERYQPRQMPSSTGSPMLTLRASTSREQHIRAPLRHSAQLKYCHAVPKKAEPYKRLTSRRQEFIAPAANKELKRAALTSARTATGSGKTRHRCNTPVEGPAFKAGQVTTFQPNMVVGFLSFTSRLRLLLKPTFA